MKNKGLIILCVGIMMFMSYYCSRKGELQSANESKITVLSLGDERILGPHWDSPPRFLVFLPLVEYSHAGPKPALAKRWEHSPDYKIWTFYLRRDVRWHDGVTTTAHDIKFSLDLMDKVAQLKQIQGIVSYDVIDYINVPQPYSQISVLFHICYVFTKKPLSFLVVPMAQKNEDCFLCGTGKSNVLGGIL